jgi:hypothetical protein
MSDSIEKLILSDVDLSRPAMAMKKNACRDIFIAAALKGQTGYLGARHEK